MSDVVLKVAGLRRSFGGVTAVAGIDFTVERGEIFGVIGPNGAGKSTLFSLIAGSDRPDAGTVEMLGRCVDTMTPSRRSRLGLSRTFQSSQVFMESTARENLAIAAVAHRRRGRADADAVLASLQLTAVADRTAELLTVFEQQRLAIAMALMSRPEIVLLDEPSGGLVEREVAELAELLRRVNDDGVSLVVIDHKMRLMTAVCDRILAMATGAPLCLGTPAEVMADAGVRAAYLGTTEVAA